MLKNYLKIAFHNLLKDKLFSAINILGLSIGLAACILIALFVLDETSYDEHWENANQIYRLNTAAGLSEEGLSMSPWTSGAAMPAFKRYFPDEIERGSRVIHVARDVDFADSHFKESVVTVDRDFIDMFEFEVVAGDLEAALADPSRVALSRESAERFFGDEEAVGRTITLTNTDAGVSRDHVVSAVYRQPSGNSVLDVPMITLLDETVLPPFYFNWTALTLESYLQLKPGIDPAQLYSGLKALTDENVDISSFGLGPDVKPSDRYVFDLQNITEIHLNSPFDPTRAGGNPTVVLAFSAIAVLVLLIGCINFTILSTTKATGRAKEVAMRKVVGAGRGQLIAQYLGEAFFVIVPALLLALVLVELFLPGFEAMVDKRLAISYFAPETYVSLLFVVVAVALLGGLYPAFVLSHFRPAATLKANRSVETRGSVGVRNALVIFQFSVAIALMVATAVIYTQVQYSRNRGLGFNQDNLLVIDNLLGRADVNARKETLKRQIAALPEVDGASLSIHQPTQKLGLANISLPYSVAGTSGGTQEIKTVTIDTDFLQTYEIPLLAGRDYAEGRDQPSPLMQYLIGGVQPETPRLTNVIVNASAARQLGFAAAADAIGKQIMATNFLGVTQPFSIIGVAADTQFFNLHAVPRAEVYVLDPVITDVLTVRYQGDIQALLTRINEVWTSVMGDAELSMGFVSQNMAREFEQEQTEANLLVSFSLLAIVIASLGLYGSASFTVNRRTKEIGIRKIMGADVREIVTLLLWQFSKPVLLANIIAWPAAVWAMLTWLQRFPYQIDYLLLLPLCVLAGALALSIAWLTVAGNTIRVVSTKPVYALRYE